MTTGIDVLETKTKRDLFKFNGQNPTAINLEHVTVMAIDGKKINFSFAMNGISVDMDTDEIARIVFDQVLKVWAGDDLQES